MKKTKENLKNTNFTKLTRNGISLIVLVITIIVIIILAAAIIISLNNNNPIMEANTAKYESDRANMQAVFTNTVAKVMAKNQATVSVSAGQINTVTGGVAETTGEVAYTLTDAQNAANATGTIVFDKKDNTDTIFYTGKKMPIYAAGNTIWYVDEEGNISLEVGGTKYGNGSTNFNESLNEYGFVYGKPYSAAPEMGGLYSYTFYEDGKVELNAEIFGESLSETLNATYDKNKISLDLFGENVTITVYDNKTLFTGEQYCTLDKNISMMDGDYYYGYGMSPNGWNVQVLDKTKETYASIPTQIGGRTVDFAHKTFEDCNKLIEAPDLPNSITHLIDTFSKCSALTKPPVLPNSASILTNTFLGCKKLTKPPEIPDSVTDMANTFMGCTSLTDTPKIPDSVTYMYGCFAGCTSLTQASAIPSKVTSIGRLFFNCPNLTGEIEINTNPTVYNDCFANTTKEIKITGLCSDSTKANLAATSSSGNVIY